MLKNNRKPFYIIGHSMGGALALLLSLLEYKRVNFIACVTFAAPKCIDRQTIINTLELVHYRLSTLHDPVTKLFFGFKHDTFKIHCGRYGHSIKHFV